MKVLRNKAKLKRMSKVDDCYVESSTQERIAFMWELTAELWSLTESENVERRLQRDVARLIKQ
jgi:hypothetical protein